MRTAFTCLCLLLFLAACSDESDQAKAARGAVDVTAPVQADAQVVIEAPAERVWAVLADISRWPSWQADIRTASAVTRPSVGSEFDWSSSAGTIHSRVALLDPGQRLAWTGHLQWFRAIHVWILTSLPNGWTAVETKESMSGWPIALLFSSSDLLETDQRWLTSLKAAAEKMPQASHPSGAD